MGISRTSDHIQIKIKMPNPSQEPPVSSQAPNEDLKDLDVLCAFKIKIQPKFRKKVYQRPVTISKSRSRFQPQSGTTSPHQKTPNQDLKDLDVLCTFKIKIESQNLEDRCIKDWGLYPSENKDVKSQSGTYSPHQRSKSGLKGQECSLYLQNQEREPKFRILVYQGPETISISS